MWFSDPVGLDSLIPWLVRTGFAHSAVAWGRICLVCAGGACVSAANRSNLRGLRCSLERLVCDRLVCDVSDGLFVPSCVREVAGWNEWFVCAGSCALAVVCGDVECLTLTDWIGSIYGCGRCGLSGSGSVEGQAVRCGTGFAQSVVLGLQIERNKFWAGVRVALWDWIRSFRGVAGLDSLVLRLRIGSARFATCLDWGRSVCDDGVCLSAA